MTNFEIATLIIAVANLPIGYWLGLRSQRVAREFAARDAAAKRRSDFLDIATDIKLRMSDPSDIRANWAARITDDLLSLKAAYIKIANELPGEERVRTRAAMADILKFASMYHGDIYANCQELLVALRKLPDN